MQQPRWSLVPPPGPAADTIRLNENQNQIQVIYVKLNLDVFTMTPPLNDPLSTRLAPGSSSAEGPAGDGAVFAAAGEVAVVAAEGGHSHHAVLELLPLPHAHDLPSLLALGIPVLLALTLHVPQEDLPRRVSQRHQPVVRAHCELHEEHLAVFHVVPAQASSFAFREREKESKSKKERVSSQVRPLPPTERERESV